MSNMAGARPRPNFPSVIETRHEFFDEIVGHGKAADVFVEMLRGFGWKIVADPFLGTGATLLACETLGRECNGTENNPATFAVALQRYQDAFGIKPELVN